MKITIRGTGIELTEAIKEYVTEKISSLEKYFGNITSANIDVGILSNHHKKGDIYYCEVNLQVPGNLLRIVKEERTLYKAIDKVRDHFKDELDKIKEKMRAKDKVVLRDAKVYTME